MKAKIKEEDIEVTLLKVIKRFTVDGDRCKQKVRLLRTKEEEVISIEKLILVTTEENFIHLCEFGFAPGRIFKNSRLMQQRFSFRVNTLRDIFDSYEDFKNIQLT